MRNVEQLFVPLLNEFVVEGKDKLNFFLLRECSQDWVLRYCFFFVCGFCSADEGSTWKKFYPPTTTMAIFLKKSQSVFSWIKGGGTGYYPPSGWNSLFLSRMLSEVSLGQRLRPVVPLVLTHSPVWSNLNLAQPIYLVPNFFFFL